MARSRPWTKTGAAVAAVAVGAVAALSVVTSAHAATSWTVAASPNPGSEQNYLHGVACADSTHCWAVGGAASDGNTQALIEQWDGSTWTVDTVPDENNGSTVQYNALQGISCTSATDCWAVGDFFNSTTSHNEPLWEYWDGSTWTASTFQVGVASDYFLNAVSCVDETHCMAVGSKNTSGVTSVWFQQWNGSVWVTDPSTDGGELNGVSCVDATHCWAVGTDVSSPTNTIIETWNGTAWTKTTSTNPGSSGNELWSVSCVTTTWCWAVGEFNAGTAEQNLFEHWDGTNWTVPVDSTASDNNSPSEHTNFLHGVTCLSTTSCFAVGAEGGLDRTLIDAWDGSAWTLVPNTPNEGTSSQFDMLNGVACGGVGFCAAVGDYSLPDPTLILQYQVVAATPSPTPTPIPVPATGGASTLAGGSSLGPPLAAVGVVLLLVSSVGYAGRRTLRRGD